MNIFIAGGGRVGFHLASLLSAENHDVTVIESEPDQLEKIDQSLDVSTLLGNTASVMLLKAAGVAKADLFVSVTGMDEINLIAAATAKGLGAKQVVARVDNSTYLESHMLYETILGLDYILSPDALTAHEIANYIVNPGIVAAEDFGRGKVQMRQIRVMKTPTTDGKRLKDIELPSGVLVGVISRNGSILIPHGDSVVEVGDLVTLIGQSEQMPAMLKRFQGMETNSQRVMIMGGGSIGLRLAQILEERRRSVKLFEWNMNRCNVLATQLKKTEVVCRDATSRIGLEEEHAREVDVFVSTTEDDERNIMAGVLAKEVGVCQSVCVVHQPDFAPLVSKLGIDHAVIPRASLANRIIKLVHQGRVNSLAVMEEGEVEILEFAVTGDTSIIGKRLEEIKFPSGALVATIIRGDTVIVPSGDDELHAADSVIIIAASDCLDAVQKLFQR